MFFAKTLIASAAIAMVAEAHLYMIEPAGWGKLKPPIEASTWPCQGLTSGPTTELKAGASATIKFPLQDEGFPPGSNTAVHGGGSCQVSINYSKDLKDVKKWHVMHTWIGGCPAQAEGNLKEAKYCTSPTEKECVRTLSYQVPANIPNGEATLAWTWFNNLGNREMYENCATVKVVGGTGTEDSLKEFPPMFAANIDNGCVTEKGVVDIPDPGKAVTIEPGVKAVPPSGNCPKSGASAGGYSGGSSAASPAAAAPAAPAAPSAAPAAPAASPAAGYPAAPAAGGACVAPAVACTGSGMSCKDATNFINCSNGCGVPTPAAAGTACKGGAVVAAKRGVRPFFGMA